MQKAFNAKVELSIFSLLSKASPATDRRCEVHNELDQAVSLWQLSKSHISPAKMLRPHEEGSLQLLKLISGAECKHCQFLGLASDHSYKGRKIAGAAGPVPSSPGSGAYESYLFFFFFITNTLEEGKGWHGPSGTLISRGIGQMSPPAGLRCQNYMCR